MTHEIKKAEKSLSLLSTNWRHRRGTGIVGIVPVWIWRPETQTAICVSSRPSAREDQYFNSKTGRESKFSLTVLFVRWRPPMDWIRPTHNGDEPYFTSQLVQMLILPRNSFTDIPRIMFNQIFGHLVAWSDWHLKLTITLSILGAKNSRHLFSQSPVQHV